MKKMVGLILIIALAISTLLACSHEEEVSEDLGALVTRPERGPGKVVYVLPDVDKVKVLKDITYKSVDDLDLKLDVYYPLETENSKEAIPVILVHGKTADKNFKDTNYLDSWGRLVAVYGYPAITCNWRSRTAPEDIKDLINYVKNNYKDLGISSDSVNVVAFSAGVEDAIKQVMTLEDSYINKIVSFYGKIPMEVLENNGEHPSFFVADGAKDTKFPKGTNDDFVEKAKGLGVDITHIIHSNGVHGFDVLNDDEETHNIIKKTLEFLDN